MGQYLNEHPLDSVQQATDRGEIEQFAIRGFVDKRSLPEGELPSLSSALMTKYGNKEDYGCVIHTANYEYTVNYKGAGEFDIIEYHPIDNNITKKIYDKERRSSKQKCLELLRLLKYFGYLCIKLSDVWQILIINTPRFVRRSLWI